MESDATRKLILEALQHGKEHSVSAAHQELSDAVEAANESRGPGRPIVPPAERFKPVTFTLPPEVTTMVKEDAAANGLSASAYVASLIRSARDSIRRRDPREFLASLVLRLNEEGVSAEYFSPATMTIGEFIAPPVVNIAHGRDFGSLWIEAKNLGTPTNHIDEAHVYFQWIRVWDGTTFEPHLRAAEDITFHSIESVVSMIKLGGKAVIPVRFFYPEMPDVK